MVGGRDGGAMAKKGICKGRLLQIDIVSVTSQVAMSRRVHRKKTRITGPSSGESGEGRGGGVDADGVGLSQMLSRE